MNLVRRILAGESGQSMIESAVAITAMLILLVAVVEFSRALYADIYIGYVAHASSRYAMVRGTTWNGTSCATTATQNCMATASDVITFAKSAAPLGIAASSSLSVAPTWPGTGPTGAGCNTANGASSPGCVVHVQVTYDFHFALPFVSTSSFLLKSISVVTIVE